MSSLWLLAFGDFLWCHEHLDHVGISFNEIAGFSSGWGRVLVELGDEILHFLCAKFVSYLNKIKKKGEKNENKWESLTKIMSHWHSFRKWNVTYI
jgi:hypothetical protein